MNHTHTITLAGPGLDAPGMSSRLIRDLFDVLVQGAEQSLRFRMEGRSTARGAAPAWLKPASDFRMLEIADGKAKRTFKLDAPSLIETMPDTFSQSDMFDDLDPRRSPLELFENAVEEAVAERADSEAFDQPLLTTCAEFQNVLGAGLDSISIVNGRSMEIDAGAMERISRLSRIAYAQRKVRLAGRLDSIRYSDCRFTLVLENGAKVPGTARGLGAETLRKHFGTDVVVTGMAEFRPSGRILRVDAELVDPAGESELKIFSVVPQPLLAAPTPEKSAESKGGLAAILGKWPGDEPIELLLAQLKARA